MKKQPLVCTAICVCLVVVTVSVARADFKILDKMIGPNDAVLLMAEDDQCLYEKNAAKNLIPASTLKVLTALLAFDTLGDDFTYKTEFYLDSRFNLTIKGYGDPLLVSEMISSCCQALVPILRQKTDTIRDIRFDDSYFTHVMVPGATRGSSQPYDAPNGALCANFNTVNFFKDHTGHLVSAEAQTPLLPFVIQRIQSSGLDRGRILLNKQESRLYAAHLFKFFIEKNGLPVRGSIIPAPVSSSEMIPIYTFESPFSLNDIVSRLLEFSNNFIANQLVLTIGARSFGAPGTLDKGVEALNQFVSSEMKLTKVHLEEGSGLSRSNKISAYNMDRILKKFQPHRFLMKKKGNTFYKTGTLDGISTRVGYMTGPDTGIYRFAIFCNSPGKSSEQISHRLQQSLKTYKKISGK